MKPKEYQAHYRNRMREQGLEQLNVWAPKELHQRIRAYVAKLIRKEKQ